MTKLYVGPDSEYNKFERLPSSLIIQKRAVFSKSECKDIIDFMEAPNHAHLWLDEYQYTYGTEIEGRVKSESNVICVSQHQDPESKRIDELIFDRYFSFLQWASTKYLIPKKYLLQTNGFDLRRTTSAGGMLFHDDGTKTNEHGARTMALVTYLNDDFEDGETVFYNQSVKVKPVTGKTILYPCLWTHPHSVNTPSSNRYTITTWMRTHL